MPAAAEVLERAVPVEADGRPVRLGQVVDDLDLERLALRVELGDRVSPWKVLRVLEGQVGGLLLAHLGLDLLEVGGRQRPRQVEVVVEAVLDRRTDAELRVREELQDGRGHHVRRAVPHGGEPILGPG